MAKLNDEEQAALLLKAQEYRRRFCPDGEVFNCLIHIEHDMLLMRPNCTIDYVDEIIDEDGTENSGQVVFDASPTMQITKDVLNSAHEALQPLQGLSSTIDYSALTTINHEISHVVLHTEKMKSRVGEALKRGVPDTGTSFRTDAREEEEANIFAGGLQAPIDAINEQTRPRDLQLKYRMTGVAARKLIEQKLRLNEVIEKLRMKRIE